ncbi:unnamed protein product [Phytophthora fragariaefolia]|uniref:Unnamed protein product n=1 Tax=Phytophthora fragariaefolia TaxID=1490495 RepID=A0A9W6X0B2_9STRA|nr:unnamed protein product [Phytophthora fragariaefolia]
MHVGAKILDIKRDGLQLPAFTEEVVISRFAVMDVELQVPPGPLGILLDADAQGRPVLEGFAPVSPSRPKARGAVETSGRVPVGSRLLAVNEHELSALGFGAAGDVLRETSHLPRTLKFRVPPLSEQFAPRRGPPPKEEEEEEDEEEEEEEEEEEVFIRKKKQVQQESYSHLPLSQQFAPTRGPPPLEEEEEEEKEEEEDEEEEEEQSSSTGDSFQQIQAEEGTTTGEMLLTPVAHVAGDQASDGSTSWTLTGSNVDGSSSTPLASSVSSASPEKLQQVQLEEPRHPPQDLIYRDVTNQLKGPSPVQPKPLSLEIDGASLSQPKELSFGTMAALAETRHFDSDDSSDDSSEEGSDAGLGVNDKRSSWKPTPAPTRTVSSSHSEEPEELSPKKKTHPSPVPLSMASNVSSGTIAASLMVQTNRFDRDDSVEEDADTEFVTAVAPAGPLGLNLDGGVLDCAVVMGFVKLRDGSKGALERNGDIVPGSVIVRINGEDFSRATLNDVRMKLSELAQQPRTLVFRLPPRRQQQISGFHSPVMRRAPTLPAFQEDFDKRRKFELALIMHYDKKVLRRRECWFCIDAKWMVQWVDFVARGGPEPGPITNDNLLHHDWRKMMASDAPGRPDTAREGLVVMKDYRVVAPMVWCLFAELHGLGEAPLLARYLMDIYAEALSDGEVNNILEVPRPKAAVLANELRDNNKMTSSDSEDDKKHKGFKIGSSGTPVNWNGDDWTFYKHAMLNAFEKSLLDDIATGAATEDATWDQDEKDAFKKKQAKIKILIQGSLSMKLAKQVMSKKTGTEMWQELCTIYEGKKNPVMTAQKVYRLQGELHRTRLRTNGDVRSHLYKLFELKDRLATQTCYNELRRKVFFSSNMSKYTPEMVREMILTADSRSKDWENSAFGNSQGKKKPGSAAGAQKGGKMQTLSDESKKKTSSTDFSCHHCGGKGHYKRNCPDLLGEEKPSGRKNAQAKYARSGAKPADTETVDPAADENDRTLKRKVVVGEAVKWATKSYDPSQ